MGSVLDVEEEPSLGASGIVEVPEKTTRSLSLASSAPPRPKLSSFLSVRDFEVGASKVLPARSLAFFMAGAEDEHALKRNRDSWKTVRLRPRVLVPVLSIDTSCSLLGHRFSAPFFISPAGGAKLANRKGDVLLTSAAGKQDILHWVCGNSALPSKDMADARRPGQTLYWQIYAKADLKESEREIREAIELGYSAFALTVDAVWPGIRERDLRAVVEEERAKAVGDVEEEEEEEGVDNDKEDDDDDEECDPSAKGPSVKRSAVWTEFDWESSVQWLRGITDLPIAVKGIQCWEDANKCLDYPDVHPWLSNHGGRQLDGAPSAVDTLLEIRQFCPAVMTQREVFVDGGVTRGADIIKALALGARGVGLGRGFLYSLVFGQRGISKAIRILKHEMQTTMALLGVTSVDQLTPTHVSVTDAFGTAPLLARAQL